MGEVRLSHMVSIRVRPSVPPNGDIGRPIVLAGFIYVMIWDIRNTEHRSSATSGAPMERLFRGQTIGSVVCFLNIPNHNIYGFGLDDGWVHPNGCTRDRYRLGHQPVDSIILSDRVGSMYSQATVRLMISTLALGPTLCVGAQVLIIKAELCQCSKATLKRWPWPWSNK